MINFRGLRQIMLILYIGIILAVMCSCNRNNGRDKPITTSRDLPTDILSATSSDLPTDIPLATSSNLPTNSPIATSRNLPAGTSEKSDELISQQLIGIWHAAPSVGSGYNNLFFFYRYNRFKLCYSQYDEAKRVIDISGKWTVDNDKLILSVDEKTVVIGGELVESSPSAASEYSIINGTIEKLVLDPPEIIEYEVGQIEKDTESPYGIKVIIDGTNYWRICDDPDDEYFNSLNDVSEISNTDTEFDTYYNTKYGYSIKYPVSWDISEEPPAGDGVFLYSTQSIDIRVYGGYLLGLGTDTLEIDDAKSRGIPVEDFTASNNQKGYKIVEKNGDRVKLQIIIYGQNVHCHLYADVSASFYEENEQLLIDMAKSILVFDRD